MLTGLEVRQWDKSPAGLTEGPVRQLDYMDSKRVAERRQVLGPVSSQSIPGDLKWDFSKVDDADPDGEALEGGLGAALKGIYLVIELETGDFQWADSVSGIEGVSASAHGFFPVCARSGSGTEEDPYLPFRQTGLSAISVLRLSHASGRGGGNVNPASSSRR